MGEDQARIDARILTYYGDAFDEDARLTTRSAQGPLEFRRTQELIARFVQGGRVLDVGGATGRHARALLDRGYEVALLDPVPRHVDAARAAGIDAIVGDARELPYPDASFDAVLMLGPLYHLASRADRSRALDEAARVCRPGGAVLAAALSRFIGFGALMLGRPVPDPLPASWIALLTRGDAPPELRFPAGHFHTAEELEVELAAAGLVDVEVLELEGPAGAPLEDVREGADALVDPALVIARALESAPAVRDLSGHLLGIARAP